ncbi:hypothetical protein [Hoeflea prorocentri]|uniref:Exostosin GT47 domain-containing protein n=1 Tax=Hoeflea prorocentri TaxID=1922333 RepID=A0A9X3UJZ3_9HYPH|nr:hypothetical protein [Hoeflea prorocentri]MCY6382195.1 hypothetical protein [Hoeflea prorocentri]MDA5399995.1 hypothetical protein [Hoeflea prorocentri]
MNKPAAGRIKRSWARFKNRRRLRDATVYDSAAARTAGDTVWSKAFICGMADVYPPRTSSDLRELVVSMDHYERQIRRSEKHVTGVYIVGSHVQEFVETIFPRIRKKIVIVTGNAVQSVPRAALGSQERAERFLDDDRIAGAWIQNLDIEHPKAFPLPLGLDFHNLHINKDSPWNDQADVLTPNQQERQLQTIAAAAPPFDQRSPDVFTHFTVGTQPAVRSHWLDHFLGKDFAQTPGGVIKRADLWNSMARSQFVASPPGAGMDCHRTWEALVLGSVPIVQHFAPMAPLFEDLPVWQVEDPSHVTAENLRQKADEVSTKLREGRYDFCKLTVGWWTDQLKRQTARLLGL